MNVELESHEALLAGAAGFRRQFNAMVRGDKPRFDERWPGQHWYNHIVGACAEMAVAKAFGIYWGGGVDTFNREDIEGTNFEVRYSPAGKPKVSPRDTRIIIGVVGQSPSILKFRIVGWLRAHEGKRPEWESDSPPLCYFPPERAWHPIEQLIEMHKCKTGAPQ